MSIKADNSIRPRASNDIEIRSWRETKGHSNNVLSGNASFQFDGKTSGLQTKLFKEMKKVTYVSALTEVKLTLLKVDH